MVIDTISKSEVDALAKSLLSYLSHYKQEQQVGSGRAGIQCSELPWGTFSRSTCNACKSLVRTLLPGYLVLLFSSTPAVQLLEEYEADPSIWAWPGPTRATAIVACLPAFMDASGHSTGGAAPMQRGASLATTQHVDPAAVAGAPQFSLTWGC
jgi:hypothetical protein